MIHALPDQMPSELSDAFIRRLMDYWGLCPELACRVVAGVELLKCMHPAPVTLFVTSGRRTAEEEAQLKSEGYMTTAPELSTHIPKPGSKCSTGVDLDILPSDDATWRWVGAAMSRAGLRWGGGSQLDTVTLIPKDRYHFDLGRKLP